MAIADAVAPRGKEIGKTGRKEAMTAPARRRGSPLDAVGCAHYVPPRRKPALRGPKGGLYAGNIKDRTKMKIKNSLKSLKKRHRDCRVIRRRGRVYVINKTNRRFKARQG